MTRPPRLDPLIEAFAELPRQRPSETFTDEVLTALTSRQPVETTATRPLIWATAATLILVAFLALTFGYQRQQAQERAYRLQVEELKSRYQELLDEVATVRHEVEAPDTRLYLGGDEKVDLMLDWSRIPTYQENHQDRRDVRPAALEQ